MSEQTTVAEETNAVAAVEKRTDDTDLETLLSQFEEGTKKEPVSPPEPTKQPAIDPATIARIQRVESRLLEEDINGAIKQVFGEIKVAPRVAKGWLDQIARENPAIARAFLNKPADPKTWDKFAKVLQKEAEKDFQESKVDEEATADHAAVAQAVRGASTKFAAEPAPDFARMTDAELAKWKMDNMK